MKIKRFNENKEEFDPKELEMGKKVEMEHNDIWDRLDNYFGSFNLSMPFDEEEFYEFIAKAHLRELPDYYSRLKIMENNRFNENKEEFDTEELDARKIVSNCLKMYNLEEVQKKNYHEDLANEIINDLVNAGLMK